MALEMKTSYILKASHSRYFTIGGRDDREIRSTNTIFSMMSAGGTIPTKNSYMLSTFRRVHYRRWAKNDDAALNSQGDPYGL